MPPEGFAFVQFSNRDMAIAAIKALNGTYVMRVRAYLVHSKLEYSLLNSIYLFDGYYIILQFN